MFVAACLTLVFSFIYSGTNTERSIFTEVVSADATGGDGGGGGGSISGSGDGCGGSSDGCGGGC